MAANAGGGTDDGALEARVAENGAPASSRGSTSLLRLATRATESGLGFPSRIAARVSLQDSKVFVDALALDFPLRGHVVLEEVIKGLRRPLEPVLYHAQRRLLLEVFEVRLDIDLGGAARLASMSINLARMNREGA